MRDRLDHGIYKQIRMRPKNDNAWLRKLQHHVLISFGLDSLDFRCVCMGA